LKEKDSSPSKTGSSGMYEARVVGNVNPGNPKKAATPKEPENENKPPLDKVPKKTLWPDQKKKFEKNAEFKKNKEAKRKGGGAGGKTPKNHDGNSQYSSDERSSSDEGDNEEMLRTKLWVNEDWQMLKKTIRKTDKMSETTMNFQEKVDNLIDKQEELLNKHFWYIREVA
jgi:hypothetical protein